MYNNSQIVLKYVENNGIPSKDANPNGSTDSIAGVSNEEGNVLCDDAPSITKF